MTYGAKVTVNSYFTGTAEVRCDYYYYWYDNYGYMHTNNATTYFQITCNPVTLTINPTSMSLYPEEGQTISYSYSPSNVSPQPTIRFLSSNTNVATVNDNGYVRAVGSGTATITVENSAGPNATCSVNVKEVDPTGISLPANLILEVDERKTLTPTIYPSYAKKSLTWSSSDETIATVSSSGSVYGKKKGTVKITVKTHNDYSDYCNVTVNDHKLTLSVYPKGGLVDDGTQVTLSADKSTASIYYTLNGTTPSQNSTKYTSPIVLHQDVTLKAIAMEDRFLSSNILTETYRIASLDIEEYNPQKDAEDVSPYAIPYIKFNQEIKESANFGSIQLLKNGKENVNAEFFIEGNKLWVVPNSTLEIGASYKAVVPENAVMSATEVPCKEFSYVFSVYPYAVKAYILGTPYSHKSHSAIIKSDGGLWMWGINDKGQLGDGTTVNKSNPTKIMDDVKDIALAYDYTLIVKNDNTLWTCGANGEGQLGDGTKTDRISPVLVLNDVEKVAAFSGSIFSSSAALKTNGTLWTWGDNYKGRLGYSTSSQLTPKQVNISGVLDFCTGEGHMAAATSSRVYTWGDNYFGQCGNSPYGSTSCYSSTPYYYSKFSDVPLAVSAGSSHTLILAKNGKLYGFGRGGSGQFGRTDMGVSTSPVLITDNVAMAVAGPGTTFAIKNGGTLYACGWNKYGQLGVSSTTDKSSLTYVMNDVIFVSTLGYSTSAIKSDGSVWAWGCNNDGALGDGTTTNRTKPVKIMDGKINLVSLTNASIPASVSIESGKRSVLPLSLSPVNGKIDSQAWVSSDENIVTVNNRGVITALSQGTATITATINGNLSATCEVTVNNPSGIGMVNVQSMRYSINNSVLTIDHISDSQSVYVCNLTGTTIYNGISKGGKISIQLHGKGVYVVKVGNNTFKIVNK